MNWKPLQTGFALFLFAGLLLAGCQTAGGETVASDEHDHADETAADDHDHTHDSQMLSLPALEPVDLNGGKLKVVATTSIIGDVVAQVGGAAIELTTLIAPGQDPHSYEPSAQDLTAVADAHIIFVNGWNLEEGLIKNLTNVAGDVPIVAVSARIDPRELTPAANQGDDAHGAPDPHVWFDPANVIQWVANIKIILSDLDPDNAAVYDQNTDVYREELKALMAEFEKRIEGIPENGRKLVANHDSLGYFADRYHFQVIGTILPAASALAAPSASELAELVKTMNQANVCAIFAETSTSDQLARSVAAELASCTAVQVLSLYTGALGEPGSGADSYIGMMRANLDTIITGSRD